MAHSVNFADWVSRLGFRRGDDPEFIYAVQPTSLVQDQRDIVPPAVGREAHAGGFEIAAAGTYAGGYFTNLSDGFVLLRIGINSTASTTRFARYSPAQWASGPARTTETQLTPIQVGHPDTPAGGVVFTADFTSVPASTLPLHIVTAAGSYIYNEWWVPPGYTMVCTQTIAASGLSIEFRWIQFPGERAV